jgi:hypothetical protein
MSRVNGSSYASKLMGRAGVLPTLSLDFTAMGGTLNPLITFSRTSNATFVNSSGYVEYASQNLYYNTNFETITTGTSNPSLTSKGWGYVFQTGSAVFNTNGSVTMTASGNRIGLLRTDGFAGGNRRIIFSVDITSVGDTGVTPLNMVNEGTKTNEAWYIDGVLWVSGNVVGPCTVSFVFDSRTDGGNSSTYFGLGMNGTVTGSATFANPRWGLYGGVNQLTYYPNTSATNASYLTTAYHGPRFDYDSTLAAKGLLLEGPATNLLNWSEKFSTTLGANNNWADTNLTRTSTNNTSPRNDATALRITASVLGNGTIISSAAIGTSASRVLSVWLRRVTGTGNIQYTLDNGATYTTQAITSSWVRYSFPATTAAQRVGFRIVTALDAIEIWGAQLETEASTSYIPTGTNQVARTVDTAIIAAGSNFSSWYTGGTTGTFVANWYGDASTPTARSVIATSDQTTKHLHMYQTPSALTLRLADFNAAATVTTGNSLTAGALTKGAFSYASTATSLCLNGGTVATGTLAFTVAPTWLSIGGPSTTGTSITDTTVMLNNSIRTLKYFPVRLSNNQIQGLTT